MFYITFTITIKINHDHYLTITHYLTVHYTYTLTTCILTVNLT